MLTKFWERIDLGGRDMNDASLFTIGEEVFPMGPPRMSTNFIYRLQLSPYSAGKSKNKKATADGGQEERLVSSLDVSQIQSVSEENKTEPGKRRRSSLTQPEGEPMVKRKRGRASKGDQNAPLAAKSKRNMSLNDRAGTISVQNTPTISRGGLSPGPSEPNASQPSIGTIIPSSSEEPTNTLLPQEHPPPILPHAENVRSQDIVEQSQDGSQIAQGEPDDPLFGSPKVVTESLELPDHHSASMNKSSSLPSHRARAANPLIKMADDLDLDHRMNSAIPTKARLLAQSGAGVSNGEGSLAAAVPRTPASKRGPGRSSQGLQAKNRSSLLVFEKGSLKSVKGKFKPSEASAGNASSSHNENAHMDQEYGNSIGDDTMEVDDVLTLDPSPEKVPTGQELLQMAGLSVGDAETLPDFEDDAPVVSTPTPSEAPVPSRFAKICHVRISPD
jgi:hypothetical protein